MERERSQGETKVSRVCFRGKYFMDDVKGMKKQERNEEGKKVRRDGKKAKEGTKKV